MADSYSAFLNLRLPEVGHANDTWGSDTIGINFDLTTLDGVFNPAGTGPAVGLHIGTRTVPSTGLPTNMKLVVDGGGTLTTGNFTFKDVTDGTKQMVLKADALPTATTVNVQAPPISGTMAVKEFVLPTGTVLSGYFGSAAPTGFVLADGRSIGPLGSPATQRANADCQALFTLFWNYGFSVLPARGASAAADWAAGTKHVVLPDHSGRTMVGRDNLSGTARGVLSGVTSGGQLVGQQTVQYAVGSGTIDGTAHVNGCSISGTAFTSGIGTNPDYSSIIGCGGGPALVSVREHSHVVNANAGVGGSVTSDGWLSGNCYPGNTDTRTNVQPTIAVDVIIAL